MGRGKKFIVKAFESLAQEAGVKDRQVIKQAIDAAFKAHDEFNSWMVKRGREVLNNLKPNEKAIVLVGRPYNTVDPGLTLDLPERLREQGILAIPIDFLPLQELGREISGDYPYMYWKSGQRMLTAGRMIARDKRLFAIYITNFGCGPDSYITKFFEREMHGKPFMVLEIDEHSSDVGVMTRCEAFLDTIRHSESLAETNLIQMHSFMPSRKNGRTIYIPYMGDHSHTFAAAIRSQGIPAESLPLSDERSLSFGRKFTTGKECFPSIITTGDIVKKVNENGFKRDKSAFFMPAAQGPCRFGQYNKLHRMVLDSLEYDDVPIMLFDQIDCYHKDVAALGKSSFKRMAWRGFVMVDLMQKMMMQIRPYEVNMGESDYVYKESLDELTGRMEKNSDLASFAAQTRHRFDRVKIDSNIKKPKIGVVGEIYVRNNHFANDFMVRKLEALGAEVSLPPMEEWVDYLDYCRKETYLENKDYKHYLMQRVAEFVQEYDANRLRKGFKGAIRDFALEDSMEKVIRCGGCYISPAILGESILSMGRAVEYAKKGFHGIVNVIPFGCMPGIVVTAILKQFRDDYPDIPIITLTVDGVKDPGGEMRLEAFVQQCCDNM
jgi:predicted nucleotide-binding protein (sugar kinase/HSP70/actin superfamily)